MFIYQHLAFVNLILNNGLDIMLIFPFSYQRLLLSYLILLFFRIHGIFDITNYLFHHIMQILLHLILCILSKMFWLVNHNQRKAKFLHLIQMCEVIISSYTNYFFSKQFHLLRKIYIFLQMHTSD